MSTIFLRSCACHRSPLPRACHVSQRGAGLTHVSRWTSVATGKWLLGSGASAGNPATNRHLDEVAKRRAAVKSAVIIGASSGVGRELARAFARLGTQLVIVARDERDLSAIASDIQLRFGVACWPVVQDIAAREWNVADLVATCRERLGVIDALLVPAGAVSPDDVGPNAAAIAPVLDVNFVGPARIAAAFGTLMSEQKSGTIVLFSSIAAAAPRSKNVAYSAAKAALETYAKGLRHSLSAFGVEVQTLALGYVDTAQSFGLRLLFPVVSPEAVARHVVERIAPRTRVGGLRYFPRFWRLVTTILRLLPWFVYRRLQF